MSNESPDLQPTHLVISVEVPEDERAKIASPDNPLRPFYPRLIELAQQGLNISDLELFSYGMYYEWTADPAGWRTYKDLADKLPKRWALYKDYLRYDAELFFEAQAPANA